MGMTTKITSIENYDPSETNLYREDKDIVLKVGEQGTLRLRPFAGSVCEIHIDNSWVVLTTKELVDLRFALGAMLTDLGVENVA
jgi:hypothetical protein